MIAYLRWSESFARVFRPLSAMLIFLELDSAHEYRARRYEERWKWITEYLDIGGILRNKRFYKISAHKGKEINEIT